MKGAHKTFFYRGLKITVEISDRRKTEQARAVRDRTAGVKPSNSKSLLVGPLYWSAYGKTHIIPCSEYRMVDYPEVCTTETKIKHTWWAGWTAIAKLAEQRYYNHEGLMIIYPEQYGCWFRTFNCLSEVYKWQEQFPYPGTSYLLIF